MGYISEKTEQDIINRYSPERYEHVKNVIELAMHLAEKHSADSEKAYTAALLHDIAKDMKVKDMVAMLESADIFIDEEILIIQNADNKKHAFYTSWTRKEAFVKALGKGIDEDFKYIPCLDGQHNIDSDMLKNTKNWQICSFDLADNYLGAVAFDGSPTISKNLELLIIPNSMKDLLEMIQIKND